MKYARLWEYEVRTKLGQEIELPAFDDSASTWERPVDAASAKPGKGP